MYNQDYEEYIRSILGYNNEVYRETPYTSYNMNNMTNTTYENDYNNTYRQTDELEQYYPEIYKIVYPMVKKVCNNNRGSINREILENMVDEIYSAIEVGEETNQENRNESKEINQNNRNSTIKIENTAPLKESRERRNPGIRDLIKILILRELLRNKHRQPMPPPRPRPPFPGNGRPPMRPRIYEDYI